MSEILQGRTATTTVERLAYSPAEAALALGVTRQTLDKLTRLGQLRVVKIGRSVKIPTTEVLRLAGLSPQDPQ
jgi:excisionase family DNA binding protein